MNHVELLHKCEQSESLKNEIYNLIIEEVKEYCKLTNNSYPEKEETCRIYIIDSFLSILYDWDGEFLELEIPLNWFTNKNQMLDEINKKENIYRRKRINYLTNIVKQYSDSIKSYESEITKLEKELNNE